MIERRLNKMFLALVIACSLLLSQFSGLHMHVQHDNGAGPGHAHTFDLHSSSDLHVPVQGAGFDTASSAWHFAASIDLSADNLLKYSASSVVLFLIVLFGWLLHSPPGQLVRRFSFQASPQKFFTYLCQPPLRAPPVLAHN